jgi:hypothetical protein
MTLTLAFKSSTRFVIGQRVRAVTTRRAALINSIQNFPIHASASPELDVPRPPRPRHELDLHHFTRRTAARWLGLRSWGRPASVENICAVHSARVYRWHRAVGCLAFVSRVGTDPVLTLIASNREPVLTWRSE